ncbi:MAG: radical SAM protein [Candidatus Omnitrophota bacterium]
MKIALLNPPSPFLIEQKAFAPLGLLYLASALKQTDFDVQIQDLANREDDLESALERVSADIYGLSASTPQYPYAEKIKDLIKKKNSQALVIIGGAHPSSEPQECLGDGFDAVVIGEGERAIADIAREFQQSGKIASSRVKSEYIKDIDTIAYPDREAIDISAYAYEVDGAQATTLITSRGCPYNCAFCSKDVWSNKVRYHSAEYVLTELKLLIEKWGFTHFLFLDDSLTLNKKRAEKLFAAMAPFNIRWRCYVRSDQITRELLAQMKDAGCIEAGIGVESASAEILKNVEKGVTIEQHTQVIQWCKELGIIANVFLMIGLPGETYATVNETKEWFERVRPDKFGFNIFYPYAGTPIYRQWQRYDIQFHDLSAQHSWVKGRKNEYRSYVSTKALTREEILRLHRELFEHFIQLTGWRTNWEGKK